MTIKLRTEQSDEPLQQIIAALREYDVAHPQAEIEVYRHTPVSVRIRVIDPAFKGQGRAQREDELWAILERLPEEVLSDITLLLLFTPEEAKKSFANVEFDDPVPSRI